MSVFPVNMHVQHSILKLSFSLHTPIGFFFFFFLSLFFHKSTIRNNVVYILPLFKNEEKKKKVLTNEWIWNKGFLKCSFDEESVDSIATHIQGHKKRKIKEPTAQSLHSCKGWGYLAFCECYSSLTELSGF